MSQSILLIDDDRKLNDLLKTYLSQFGLEVTAADRPQEGLRLLQRLKPRLVILDVMLPDMDGFQVLREIRKSSQTPVIMLTARGELADKVVGLETGADDYLSKPFEPRELVARVQSVLRRLTPKAASSEKLISGALTLDLTQKTAALKGKPLDLTTTEFEVLAFFMANPGAALSRDQIMEYLKGIECEAYNRSIDITVSRVRKKLGDTPAKPKFFKTVWGTGYLFLGKVKTHEA